MTYAFKKALLSGIILQFFLFFQVQAEIPPHPLKINVFSCNNGKGLQASRQILKQALSEMGHEVYEKEHDTQRGVNDPQVDLNIFFELIPSDWLSLATANWFIPNPEWYVQEMSLLDGVDLILCRTREVERIFQSLNKRTFYIGFTSRDCEKTQVNKDFFSCLHIAGGSKFKGTEAIVHAWRSNPYMPDLKLVLHFEFPFIFQKNLKWITERIETDNLRELQNTCGIHLCLSETEGFGHYLMEALSTGAVVVTTDAPPMNEFVTDPRCLVSYHSTEPMQLGIRYFADADQLRDKVLYLMSLSPDELKKIGDNNRLMYMKKTQEFYDNLKKLMREETSAGG